MKFEISLNNRNYEILVELAEPMTMQDFQRYAPAAPTAAAAVSVAAASPEAPVFVNSGECVTAPMPGNILRVAVAVGDKVTEGQVLVILEAMKMENEIMAPCAGTVTQVLTSKGSTVDTGAPMIVIS